MKKLMLALAMLLCLPAAAQSETQVYCINVGKGDAILLMAGGYTFLIDTGKAEAEDAIRAALTEFNITQLDAVFITHTDKDHVGGLKWLKKEKVHAIYASACYTCKENKHPAVKAAKKLGLKVQWLRAGDELPVGGSGAVLRVLAPFKTFDEENDNSLVMMFDGPDGRVLFTGDMEFAEEEFLLASDADLECDVLKVPNHADDDACSQELIRACKAKYAVISTDSMEKPETPDPRILKALEKQDTAALVTQDSIGGILLTLANGEVTAEYR